MRKDALIALMGIVIGFLLAERQRPDRSLEEMVPILKTEPKQWDIKRGLFSFFADLVRQGVQPGMSKHESAHISQLIIDRAMQLMRFDEDRYYRENEL